MKLAFSRRARLDLVEIGDYLERVAGARTAHRWMARLEERALGLAANPYVGADDPDLGGRRRLVVPPYLIVYRVVSDDLVRVVRIVHGLGTCRRSSVATIRLKTTA